MPLTRASARSASAPDPPLPGPREVPGVITCRAQDPDTGQRGRLVLSSYDHSSSQTMNLPPGGASPHAAHAPPPAARAPERISRQAFDLRPRSLAAETPHNGSGMSSGSRFTAGVHFRPVSCHP